MTLYNVSLNADFAKKIVVESLKEVRTTGDYMFRTFPSGMIGYIMDSRFDVFDKNLEELELFEWLMAHIIVNEDLVPVILFDHNELLWSA